ncbi:MAG: glycosyltransferase, partial [Acidimicrobiales bacterium]
MTSITVLTADFPSCAVPDSGAFVHTLWTEVQRQGSHVDIVSPTRFPIAVERRGIEDSLRVTRPRFLSPGVAQPFPKARRNLSHRRWIESAKKVAENQRLPDFFFGQFLHPAGEAAAVLGDYFERPSFVEISEDTTDRWVISRSTRDVQSLLHRFTGIVTVSNGLSEAISEFGVSAERVIVSPNGIDHGTFSPGDRSASRANLNLPTDLLLTATVARHVVDKGVQVVADALAHVADSAGLFVGAGPTPPVGSTVMRAQAVAHNSVAEYLSAADIFVLPSLAEGCANAVLEAMAVGLPLVLSDRPFMREIADESFAIFVDPTSVDSVAEAIAQLKAD